MGRHSRKLSDADLSIVRGIMDDRGVVTMDAVGQALKCGRAYAKLIMEELGATGPRGVNGSGGRSVEDRQCISNFECDGDTGEITIRNKQVTSLEEALEFFEVDLDVWQVQKHVVNQWGDGSMLQVKVWLERLVPKPTEDAVKELIERSFEGFYIPIHQQHEPLRKDDCGHMLLISPVDHHFGKMAWAPETGDDYDIKIAERLYVGAIDDALQKTAGYHINEIHIPVGSDLFHFDSSRGKTANETQMDVDSRPQKVFVAGSMAVIAAVERAAEVANVYIHFVPGNHDPTWSHHLCVVLWARFQNDQRVTVDFGPAGRKYIEYGTNLLLLTHGDMSQQNLKMLPLQLAVSEPVRWGRTTNREIHIGHVHHQKEVHYIPLEEHSGVVVRTLPSLCGTDEWHYTKGFINNQRAMLSILYSFKRGYTGQFQSYAKDILERMQ